MKNLLYIISLFIFTQSWAQAGFEKGNELYTQGKFKEAAQSYESILKSGQESAEVYFNLGNAYYKLDSVAPAIYNYEKALLLRPNYKDAAINLGYAQKMTIDNIEAVPQVGFSKMLYNFTSAYHYNQWAWAAVIWAFGFLILFIGYYLTGRTLFKRIFFIGMFIALLAILLSIFSAVYVKSALEDERPAIVFSEVVSVKSEPLQNADDAFILHEGTKVYVTETLDNWKKITLANDTEGWIPAGAIKELKQ